MKSTSELTDFYYKTLYPVLEELEKEREQLKHRIITLGVIYTVVVALIALVLFGTKDINILIFIAFAYITGGGLIYKFLVKDYTSEFKEKIIFPLITAMDENLNYSAYSHIDSSHFRDSKIFNTRVDRVSGNDYVYGEVDGIKIQFSDFHAEKKHKDSKGRTLSLIHI